MSVITANPALLELIARLGCDPPRCHCCEGIYFEGDELGVHASGAMVHDACVGRPLRLPVPNKKKREKLLAAVTADPSYRAPVVRGCWLTAEELAIYEARPGS